MQIRFFVALIALLFADAVAAQKLVGGVGSPAHAAKSLGSVSNDLVYTPIAPCRLVDTRSTAAGAIGGGTVRNFLGINASDFTAQGGSATNCGTFGLSATGLMLHVTAMTPALAGNAVVYSFASPQPATTSLQYSAGAIVSSAVLAQIPNPRPLSSFDFSIFTSATSHFTVDIVGYFAPPSATALDCTTVSGVPTSVGAGAYTSLPVLFCAANYTPIGLSISAGENVLVADSYTAGNAGEIYVRSLSVNAQNVTAKLTCCRVPGR
jgi:hypothetical protein